MKLKRFRSDTKIKTIPLYGGDYIVVFNALISKEKLKKLKLDTEEKISNFFEKIINDI